MYMTNIAKTLAISRPNLRLWKESHPIGFTQNGERGAGKSVECTDGCKCLRHHLLRIFYSIEGALWMPVKDWSLPASKG